MSDMSIRTALIRTALPIFESSIMPDTVTRLAIDTLVGHTRRNLANIPPQATAKFACEMKARPIAIHTDAANAQHYEVPAAFFVLVLGAQRKYSCCYYENPSTSLDEAEEFSLSQTAAHAGLADGQSILELGCGWGSLSLWMARAYPLARITAVSNSYTQRTEIEKRAADEGLSNLTVITADANTFDPKKTFDRIVSIEMFEHMSNWHALLARLRQCLHPDGRLFLHVFTHHTTPYRFDHNDSSDWIGKNFFTGGIMPSARLIDEFSDLFHVEQRWQWAGTHYARTAKDWLTNLDANSEAIMRLFETCYGRDAALWHRRWRLFFLATEGLFGHDSGCQWGVCHYRLAPT